MHEEPASTIGCGGGAADDVSRGDSARRRRDSFLHLESLWTFTLRESLERRWAARHL